MAQTATIYTLEIQLSDVDRGVYETLALRVACHPSETEEYLWTRILAYCLEYAEGIAFSKGLSEPDEPAVVVRDLTGTLVAWIEVGAPDAARLHRASKASPRVAVYTHKEPRLLQRQYEGERIHRSSEIGLYAVDRELLEALVARLERRLALSISVTEGTLYVTIGSETLSGEVVRHPLTASPAPSR
ncbi:MAG: YaeQ family protein [Gemmatimonadota bacterium]